MTSETTNSAPAATAPQKPEKPVPTTFGQRAQRIWREYLRSFVIIVLTLTSFRSAVADWNDVPTGSMRPTILEGDRIFVNKAAYGLKIPFTTIHLLRWDKPDRGEIVVFFSPEDGRRMVKRVIGVGGDTVEMRNNHLYINGKLLSYGPDSLNMASVLPAMDRVSVNVRSETIGNYTHAVIDDPRRYEAMRSFDEMKVPEGHYFLMGDNRDNSRDSRYYRFVPEDQIVGRSSRVAVSVDPERSYRPRWDRFLKAMP